MHSLRLLVAGTPGSGKSTFIRTISNHPVIDTDRTATDATQLIKPKTTVALDYGRVSLDSNVELQLYGAPGQLRFSFMWDILIRRVQAYLVLIAAHRPGDLSQAREIITHLNQRSELPMVVGVTHSDCLGASRPELIMFRLGYKNLKNCPMVVKVNANDQASVSMALNALLMSLLMAKEQAQPLAIPAQYPRVRSLTKEPPGVRSVIPLHSR